MVLGDVELTRIVEWHEPFLPTSEVFPEIPGEVWDDNERWLAPDHWDPVGDRTVIALQSWLLRSAGLTVLVDTGAGDNRERPGMAPWFHRRGSDLPGLLGRVGVRPEDVDVVVNTHLHVDHVGGNTRDLDGEWRPTFPHARYLIPAGDDAHYRPDGPHAHLLHEVDHLVYSDSIAPIHRAGQAVLWDGVHRIDRDLVLEAAPGHTPGSSVLRLASRGDRAVFAGDVLHSPVQVLEPGCSSSFCHDPGQAAVTRRRLLGRAVDERELVVPAHLGGAGVLQVRRGPDGFELDEWAMTS